MERIHETNYGIIIRINRESQNLSLKSLSEISGVSLGHISKIERQKENASNEMIFYLFEALCIDFNTVVSNNEMIQQDFWDFYRKFVYHDTIENITRSFHEFKNKYHDYESVEHLLIHLIYHLIYEIDIKKCDEMIQLLNPVSDYIYPSYKQIFYFCLGLYFKENKHLDKANYYLEQAFVCSHQILIQSMILYHLSIVYCEKKQLIKAHQSIIQAKRIFFETNNFIHEFLSDYIVAKIYYLEKEYDEAIQILENCLYHYKRIHISTYEISKIYLLFIEIYILKEEFKKANEIIYSLRDDVLFYLDKNDSYLLYKIILLVHLKENKLALKECKRILLNYDENNLNHNYIMYYFYFIQKNKLKRMKYLFQCKSLIDKSHAFSNHRFLLKLWNHECSTDKQVVQLKDYMICHFIEQ